MERRLLIVGIDPGITTAYCAIDLDGNPAAILSSKNLDINKIISDVIAHGRPIIAGTDKAKTPGLVLEFASKVGARIISPGEDLKVEEKKKMTSSFETNDSHQSDALAAALFAYKEIKPLLMRIDSVSERTKKTHLKDKIKELVLLRKISIKHAISILESKDEEDEVIGEVISERRLSEKDFLLVYSKLKRLESENKILKDHSISLSNRIKNLESVQSSRTSDEKAVRDLKKAASLKEGRIRFLENTLNSKDKSIERLGSAIRNLNAKIAKIGDYYILKKLDNLGANEYSIKNKVLNIRKNDILLIDDPSIISDSFIEEISEKVFVIVHKKPLGPKMRNNLPFIFIDAKKLRIEEDKYFAFVGKMDFEKAKDKETWMERMIESYKKQRPM